MKKAAISALMLIAILGARSQAQTPLPALPDLSFAPIGASDKHVGDRWSYMEAGKRGAPAVVLLHGIGGNSAYWRLTPSAHWSHSVSRCTIRNGS